MRMKARAQIDSSSAICLVRARLDYGFFSGDIKFLRGLELAMNEDSLVQWSFSYVKLLIGGSRGPGASRVILETFLLFWTAECVCVVTFMCMRGGDEALKVENWRQGARLRYVCQSCYVSKYHRRGPRRRRDSPVTSAARSLTRLITRPREYCLVYMI